MQERTEMDYLITCTSHIRVLESILKIKLTITKPTIQSTRVKLYILPSVYERGTEQVFTKIFQLCEENVAMCANKKGITAHTL
jgi:hypothetical protein